MESDSVWVEVWKDIEGFPGYQVSTAGRVRSCWGNKGEMVDRWKIMKIDFPSAYYPLTAIGPEHARRTFNVHVLVLNAFVGPPPPGMLCRHLDGNPRNNRLDNLVWGTPKENRNDMKRHGTHLFGENHPNTKLSNSDVREMRKLAAEGELNFAEIGRKFGVSRQYARTVSIGRFRTEVKEVPSTSA